MRGARLLVLLAAPLALGGIPPIGAAEPAAAAAGAASDALFDGFAEQGGVRRAVALYTRAGGRRFDPQTELPYPKGERCGVPGRQRWLDPGGATLGVTTVRIGTDGRVAWRYRFRHPQVPDKTVSHDLRGRFTDRGERFTASYRTRRRDGARRCDTGVTHLQVSVPRYRGTSAQGLPVAFRVRRMVPPLGGTLGAIVEASFSARIDPCAEGLPTTVASKTDARGELLDGGRFTIGAPSPEPGSAVWAGLFGDGLPPVRVRSIPNRTHPAEIRGDIGARADYGNGTICTADVPFTAQRTHPEDAFRGPGNALAPLPPR
jgi:hypothetical protein